MGEFAAPPFERLLKKAGARRVSKQAAKELARIMEERMLDLLKEAASLAKHAGRKTVLLEDVRLARKSFK